STSHAKPPKPCPRSPVSSITRSSWRWPRRRKKCSLGRHIKPCVWTGAWPTPRKPPARPRKFALPTKPLIGKSAPTLSTSSRPLLETRRSNPTCTILHKIGTLDLADSDRQTKPEEAKKPKANTGKYPIAFMVGYVMLSVFGAKDNPLNEIAIEQLAEIYGENPKITKWS